MIAGADVAPLVIVRGGRVFFGGDCGVVTTASGSAVSTGLGFADVIVVADVGVIVGEATGGGDAEEGDSGVESTAIVIPKRIIPKIATSHVIVVRTLLRRGTITVGLSCDAVSSRRCIGGASGTAGPRPE